MLIKGAFCLISIFYGINFDNLIIISLLKSLFSCTNATLILILHL